MNGRRVVEDVPATPHFDFLYGRYHLSSWVIPYFSTTMPLKHAADSLGLATDLAGSDDVVWKLDELYQREVDWPRVERRIVPYLRATEQPQFFNALTIALLPRGQSLSEMRYAFDAGRAWRPPLLSQPDRFQKTVTVGPIACGYWNEWNDFSQAEAKTGQIRWNPEEVFAVALDGQHRLAAMQEFVKNPGIPDEKIRDTSVPVIFVALDPRFGYETPVPKSLVDVLRVVFIDLNKHAKIPTRARQILLDDKDPTSVCVRALVGETVTGDTGDLDAEPRRLPLSLVDWHTEQAKCDDGPYVTTILTLDWAIASLLGAKPVQDFMDYAAIRKQVQALSRWLAIDMTQARERLDNLEGVELQPFGYSESPDNDELARIQSAFQRIWNPVFVSLLTDFAPYRNLLDLRAANGTFTLDFANWYRLYHQQKKDPYEGRATAEYRQLLGRLQTGPSHLGEVQLLHWLRMEIEAGKRNLAFNVVFQRAYFLAFSEWIMVDDSHLDDLVEAGIDEDAFNEEEDYGDQAGEQSEADGVGDSVADGNGGLAGDAVDVLAARVKQRAHEFVKCLNVLVDKAPHVLQAECLFEIGGSDEQQRFWLGTLVTADNRLDFTQGASLRAKEIIFWAVAMQMYDERVDPDTHSQFEEFWADVMEPDGSFARRVHRSVKRFADREASAGGRILAARDEEFAKENSWEEATERMKWLWNSLEL